MNVSIGWLRAVAPSLDDAPDEIVARLAERGAPVEEVIRRGEGLDDIRVARVREVREHPNADRLRLCDVDTGEEVLQVVCGAPNVEAGGVYPFAPVGATLPSGLEIGKAKIRGEVSHGMLCSEQELGMGKEHDGILALPEQTEIGIPFIRALGLEDLCLDVEVTANRGDLLSHVGIARELVDDADAVGPSEIQGAPELDVAYERDGSEAAGADATIRIEDPDLCGRYLGAVIRGVRVGPSPPWLRERLRSVGARPINNVVDATNFVLHELGQPLHAFDLERLADRTIVVRTAREGESLRTLDGENRKLESDMLCICDAERPVALAGIMGGEESEVDGETTDLLLECALFEPKQVRFTRQRLSMSTDASYRFERGVDPDGMERALEQAVRIILSTAGGSLVGPILDVHPRPWEAPTVALRMERIERLLGIPFTRAEVTSLLTPLGFRVAGKGEGGDDGEDDDGATTALRVVVPGWRRYDVTREVDLIEEVARTHGFDAFPSELPAYRPGTVPDHPLFALEERIRELLVGRGFFEAQVPAFASEADGEVALANPLSAEEGCLRSSLLPGLVRRVENNLARGVRDVRLFELGTCFFPTGEGELPREETHLAVVATGRRRPPHWSGEDPPVDLWDLKGWLEELAALALGETARIRESAPGTGPGSRPGSESGSESGSVEPGTGFHVEDEGEPRREREGDAGRASTVGWGGRIPSDRLDAPPWAGAVWGLELVLPAEPPVWRAVTYRAPSPYPGVSRDFALVLPDELHAGRLIGTIEEAAGSDLQRVEIFDLYRGPGVDEGARSVAYRLHFSSRERTLTDDEVDAHADRVVLRLKEEFGVQPRS